MYTYVLTYRDNTGKTTCANGVWGAFTSIEKAMDAVTYWTEQFNEKVIMNDHRTTLWRITTDKSIYIIEEIKMDSYY